MSNIFDLTTIMNENTNNIFKTNVANTNGSSYLESAFSILSDLSKNHNSTIMELYSVMNEADDKAKENDCLCNYFEEVSKLISKFNRRMEELVSKFIINIDNIVDANSDLLDNNDIITSFKPFSYRYNMFNIDNISNPEFPRLDVLSIYKKEFDFIGQLMQDLGHGASNTSKLEVIATVYNKLNTSAATASVTKKCIDSIIGIDKDNNIETFTSDLYNMFSNSDDLKDVVINKSIMYNLKTSLANYKTLENSGVASAESLVKQFDQIMGELKEILTCNKNHTLKIDTETDGIKNTTYSMDTYSLNQLDLFMKAKINQIMEMVNIYTIAVSIKLDAITDYFEQCKDIIHMAEMSCDNKCSGETDSEDNTTEINTDEDPSANDNNTDMADTDSSDLSDDTLNDTTDSDDDNQDDNSQEGSSEDNDNDTTYSIDDIDTSWGADTGSEDNDNDSSSVDENIEDASSQEFSFDDENVKESDQSMLELIRQFNYDLYQINEEYKYLSMIENAMIITEAPDNGQPAAATPQQGTSPAQAQAAPAQGGTDQGAQSSGKDETIMDKARASAEVKQSLWRRIINKIAELWNKFKSKFTKTYNDKVKNLDQYASYFKKPAHDFSPDSGQMMPKIHTDNLTGLKIPNANFEALKDKLKDENTFFASFASAVKRDKDQTIQTAVQNYIIEPDQYYKNMNELNPEDLYEWCRNSNRVVDEIKRQTDTINKGRHNAESIAKQYTESTIISDLKDTLDMYFNEADFKTDKKDDSAGSGDDKVKSTTDALMVYFNVCGQVLAAEMTCCHKIFNEYYAYLMEHVRRYDANTANKNAENKSDNGGAASSTADVPFN